MKSHEWGEDRQPKSTRLAKGKRHTITHFCITSSTSACACGSNKPPKRRSCRRDRGKGLLSSLVVVKCREEPDAGPPASRLLFSRFWSGQCVAHTFRSKRVYIRDARKQFVKQHTSVLEPEGRKVVGISFSLVLYLVGSHVWPLLCRNECLSGALMTIIAKGSYFSGHFAIVVSFYTVSSLLSE